jgi:DNA-binding Xre family transcriptional regulator
MKLELKSLRKKRSLTQKQLAELCNTSTQKISRLEQDRFDFIERDLIDALCAVLYCKVSDLIKVESLSK